MKAPIGAGKGAAPWQDRTRQAQRQGVAHPRCEERHDERTRLGKSGEPQRSAAPQRRGDSTQAVWAAEAGPYPYGAAVVPVVHAATFAYPDFETWREVATGRAAGHIYSPGDHADMEAEIARPAPGCA